MESTTYRKLSELIRDEYYKGEPSDDAMYSTRFIAEMIAQEVAEMATMNAFENSKSGDTTYANDQFISTYKLIPILVDTDGEKYSVFPSTPTALPNNQEVAEVTITGNKCMSCVPMTSRQSFSQSLIGLPAGMVMYKIENGRIVYVTSNPLLEGTATIKLIGAVSGDNLLTSVLNIPKNFESRIMTKILAKLLPLKQQPIDVINDSTSNPS